MPALAITTDWTGPEIILRGQDVVVSVTVEQGGEAIDITSASVALWKPDGTVASTGTPTPSANTVSHTFAGSLTEDEDPGEGWRVVWTLGLDTTPALKKLIQPAAVVLYTVEPCVTVSNLEDRHDALLNLKEDEAERTALLQAAIDEAWIFICEALRQKGRRPYLVLDSYALREAHILKSLEIAYHRLATGGEQTAEWSEYKDYEGKFTTTWDGLTFSEADPATWERTGRRASTSPALWLGSGRGTGRYRQVGAVRR